MPTHPGTSLFRAKHVLKDPAEGRHGGPVNGTRSIFYRQRCLGQSLLPLLEDLDEDQVAHLLHTRLGDRSSPCLLFGCLFVVGCFFFFSSGSTQESRLVDTVG